MVKISHINKKTVVKYVCGAIIAFFLLFILGYIVFQTVIRMAREVTLAYTADAPIYWTVGRGMLQGLKPYVDLYETKPPGIFLLSALSFALTDTSALTNAICFICLLIIGATPAIGVFICTYRKVDPRTQALMYACAAVFGILIMLYAQKRSGEAQVESIGAGFAAVYLLLILSIDGEKTRYRSPKIWLAALFLMCSVMMKEPFLLVCVSCALLLIYSRKDLIKKLLLPLAAGGTMGVLVLLATGTLGPYLRYYLPNMMGGHISRYGSPWVRGLQVERLIKDMSKFTYVLPIIIILLAIAVVVCVFLSQLRNPARGLSGAAQRVYHILKLLPATYLIVFSVGLGGQYYNHHFVFAVPAYLMMFLFCTQYAVQTKRPQKKQRIIRAAVTVGLCAICVTSFFLLPPNQHISQAQIQAKLNRMQTHADYVDQLLIASGNTSYQFFGFNGDHFYCLTQHAPQGPIFFQDPYNFTDMNNWFSQSLKNQMDQVNLVVVHRINTGAMNDYIQDYLEEYFTLQPWESVEGITAPEDFSYKVYYRK